MGAAAATVLALCRPGSIAVTLVLMALIVGAMHGVNMILTCHMPAHFAAVGAVSGISGLVNMFTYLGSAVSAYGIAACSERFGWGYRKFLKEADTGEGIKFPASLRFYFTWILPVIVLIIFVVGYEQKFHFIRMLKDLLGL